MIKSLREEKKRCEAMAVRQVTKDVYPNQNGPAGSGRKALHAGENSKAELMD